MKNQALFSLKDKSKKIKCPLLQFLFGALRVKEIQFEPAMGLMEWFPWEICTSTHIIPSREIVFIAHHLPYFAIFRNKCKLDRLLLLLLLHCCFTSTVNI